MQLGQLASERQPEAAAFMNTGEPAIDPLGTLTYTPGQHTFGVANVTIEAVDNA